MPKTKKTVKTTKPAKKTKTTKPVKTKKVVKAKPATKSKKTKVAKTNKIKPANPFKRGPGRPKGSKNNPKAGPIVPLPDTNVLPECEPEILGETNDRLGSTFDHEGKPEPESIPRHAKSETKYTLAKPVVENASVVLAEPERGPVQKIDPISLPKAQPVSDDGIVVMKTSVKDAPLPEFVAETASIKNEDGVLIMQEPQRKS
jgi:hypothetical protein